INATTAYPSCGSCHGNGRTGERGPVTTRFSGAASIPSLIDSRFSMSISSAVPGTKGGFALTTDKGSFIALGNTQAANSGTALTHTNQSTRSWSFKFRPSQTGLVKWYAASNTVDGDSSNKNDSWGFYGPDPSIPGTPFRVFVNDSQVFPYGTPCAGTKGFAPLLGAARNATRGQVFNVELYNAPPQKIALGLLGSSNKSMGALPLPFPLDALGAKGCQLNTSMDILMPVLTAGSGAGGGKAVFPWPIPSDASLRGFGLYFSALVIDPAANALKLTNSGGLRAVIQ
ncbi:MAG: choice-of-anchor V domain-containing protein, partial [Planctomycetota bacterium]